MLTDKEILNEILSLACQKKLKIDKIKFDKIEYFEVSELYGY